MEENISRVWEEDLRQPKHARPSAIESNLPVENAYASLCADPSWHHGQTCHHGDQPCSM